MAHDGHASTNNGAINSQGDCAMRKIDTTKGSNESRVGSIPAIPFSISGECYSAGRFGTETIEGYRSEVMYTAAGATSIYSSLLTNGRLRLNGKWVCGLPLGTYIATPVYNQSPLSPTKDDLWCYDFTDGGVYPVGSPDQERRYIVVITSCNFIDSDLIIENEDAKQMTATQDPVAVPEFKPLH